MKPVALVTGIVSDHRVEPFRALHEMEQIEVLAWQDPGPSADLPIRRTRQGQAARLVASGAYRAVIGGLGGRVALPATYTAARRCRIPFVLWASLWDHPRTAAHTLSYLPMRMIYKRSDAVATYGPHVTRYIEQFRTTGNIFEAPQAVDPAMFGREVTEDEIAQARRNAGAEDATFIALYSGRLVPEKGLTVLEQAWRSAQLPPRAALLLAGDGPIRISGEGVHHLGPVPRPELVPLYAAADALLVPSVPTATFREPWGLVCNEAMHQATAPVASDAVGAAAGGLVLDGRTGFVVPAGDADALAARITALATSPGLSERLGNAARERVASYTPQAWAEGMSHALAAVGVSAR